MNGTQIFLDIFISANFSAGKTWFDEIIVPKKHSGRNYGWLKKKNVQRPVKAIEQVAWTSKVFLWSRENQISQGKKLALCSVCEGARVWVHWNHSVHASHLSWGHEPSIFHILSSLGFILGSGSNLIAVRPGVYSSFLSTMLSRFSRVWLCVTP